MSFENVITFVMTLLIGYNKIVLFSFHGNLSQKREVGWAFRVGPAKLPVERSAGSIQIYAKLL